MSRTDRNTNDESRADGQKARVVPELAWRPLAVGGMMLAVGLISLAAGQPWLFPSLGPTAYLQAEMPDSPASRPYHTVVGHLIGMASAFLAVAVLGIGSEPSVMTTQHLTPARVWASAIAVTLTMLVMGLLKASHPPAAATALLVALGGFHLNGHDARILIIGVLLIAAIGEAFRQVRLRVLTRPTP